MSTMPASISMSGSQQFEEHREVATVECVCELPQTSRFSGDIAARSIPLRRAPVSGTVSGDRNGKPGSTLTSAVYAEDFKLRPILRGTQGDH
jgi:hypothetical protein